MLDTGVIDVVALALVFVPFGAVTEGVATTVVLYKVLHYLSLTVEISFY